jgi:simple sugar transport system permease protein
VTPRRATYVAFGLAVVAVYITLPPITLRTPIPSIVLGVAGAGLGVWALRGGERRLGWTAILSGVLAAVLAIAFTHSGKGNLGQVFVWSALVAAMLRYATPLIFAAVGGMFSERSGVVNIGLEGMLLMGAFFGVLGADKLGSWVWGVVAAAIAGGLLALVHAVVSIHMRADQILSGTAVWFLAIGLTGYMFVDIYGPDGTPGDIPAIPDVHIGAIDSWPFIGDAFGDLNLMIWVGLASVVVSYFVVFRTAFGLRLRSVGEHPRAAESVGLSVYRIRYTGVVLSGVLAGLGGAFLSIGFVDSFSEDMTAGTGFIALAALIFGNWRPQGLFAAALLFGFASAIAQRLPVYSDSLAVLFQALPYLLTLIAVAGIIGRPRPPAAVGIPYVRS